MTSVAATKAGMSRGVAWMAVFKVAERLIALVSMTVLARLLVPADFGLVVLATSMIGVLEVLGAFGLDTALIREREATSGHFDAVWTFNALFALAVAIVVAALAPAVAWLYGEPRLTQVLLVLALARAIGGLESPGPLAFRKELAFDREVAFLLAKRLAMSALVTLPLAFVLRSYWALVAGTFAGTCLSVALSYVVHPYRPTFSLRELPALMHFSKWLFVANLLEVLHGRAADFVIGYSAGPSALGAYTAGREVARVASGEIAAPVNRAVFPGYVKLAADRAELRRACLRVTSVLALFIIPAAVGLCLLARPAVLLLLGEKWLAAVPIVQLLAVQGALAVLVSTGHYVNLAVGMSRSTTLVLAASAAISLPLILVLVPAVGATGAAAAVLAASLVTAPLNLHLLAKAIPLRARDVGGLLWRPAVGSAAMAGVLWWLERQLEWPATLPAQLGQVLVLIAAGAITYATFVALAWSIHHDAHSAEAWIVRTVGDRLQRSRRASVSTSD